ncbi:MAG: hypothetical protein BWY63_02983 [Chloroflexi bacterium ADurb.Bin360]|nr:MAG: hypothetical protein BWY63_02983 [Chloroflexi bacterium ADurb.Bin360]
MIHNRPLRAIRLRNGLQQCQCICGVLAPFRQRQTFINSSVPGAGIARVGASCSQQEVGRCVPGGVIGEDDPLALNELYQYCVTVGVGNQIVDGWTTGEVNVVLLKEGNGIIHGFRVVQQLAHDGKRADGWFCRVRVVPAVVDCCHSHDQPLLVHAVNGDKGRL